jgi:hypothetical protein
MSVTTLSIWNIKHSITQVCLILSLMKNYSYACVKPLILTVYRINKLKVERERH